MSLFLGNRIFVGILNIYLKPPYVGLFSCLYFAITDVRENIFIYMIVLIFYYSYFLKILCIIFREGGREEKERERNIDRLPLTHPQPCNRDLACNPGMCPDQEFNGQPFTLWNDAHLSHTSQGFFSTIL